MYFCDLFQTEKSRLRTQVDNLVKSLIKTTVLHKNAEDEIAKTESERDKLRSDLDKAVAEGKVRDNLLVKSII